MQSDYAQREQARDEKRAISAREADSIIVVEPPARSCVFSNIQRGRALKYVCVCTFAFWGRTEPDTARTRGTAPRHLIAGSSSRRRNKVSLLYSYFHFDKDSTRMYSLRYGNIKHIHAHAHAHVHVHVPGERSARGRQGASSRGHVTHCVSKVHTTDSLARPLTAHASSHFCCFFGGNFGSAQRKSLPFWKVSAEKVLPDCMMVVDIVSVLSVRAQCTLQIAKNVEKASLARSIQLLGIARLRLIFIGLVFAECEVNAGHQQPVWHNIVDHIGTARDLLALGEAAHVDVRGSGASIEALWLETTVEAPHARFKHRHAPGGHVASAVHFAKLDEDPVRRAQLPQRIRHGSARSIRPQAAGARRYHAEDRLERLSLPVELSEAASPKRSQLLQLRGRQLRGAEAKRAQAVQSPELLLVGQGAEAGACGARA
eukprot:scaffold2745_cov79-Phaeocystis_antarctica.AAC.2